MSSSTSYSSSSLTNLTSNLSSSLPSIGGPHPKNNLNEIDSERKGEVFDDDNSLLFRGNTGADSVLNFLSYQAVDRLIWLGIWDLVNRWRVRTLHVPPIPFIQGHRIAIDRTIPHIYSYSEVLLDGTNKSRRVD